jgi:spermidine/putrescine-binding protein
VRIHPATLTEPAMISLFFWVCAALLCLCTPCSAETGSLTLRFLVYEGYVTEELMVEFRELIAQRYGVELTWSIRHVEREQQLFDMTRAGEVDIISAADSIPDDERFRLIDRKLVVPIRIEHVPNYRELYPSNQRMAHLFRNGAHYGVPLVTGFLGLVYDTAVFPDPPKTLKVFFDPKHAGKFLQLNYLHQIAYLVALAIGFRGAEAFDYESVSANPEFLEKFGAVLRGTRCFEQAVETADAYIRTNAHFALGQGFNFSALAEEGRKWALADTEEGHIGWVDSLMPTRAAATDPVRMRIVEEFLNFAISERYQRRAILEGVSSWPVNRRVLEKFTEDDRRRWPHLLRTDIKEKKLIYPAPLSLRARNGFRALHRKLLGRPYTELLCDHRS